MPLNSMLCAFVTVYNKGTSFHFLPEGLVKKLQFQVNVISQIFCRLPE